MENMDRLELLWNGPSWDFTATGLGLWFGLTLVTRCPQLAAVMAAGATTWLYGM